MHSAVSFEGASRRDFIKQFTLVTACSLAFGKVWKANVLAEIQPTIDPDTAVFRLKVSDYAALQKDYGSVRISTSPVAGTQSTSIFPVIMINRAPGGEYYALEAACTHEGCILPTLDAVARRIECLCHGSRFGVDGRLLRGPAGQALLRYDSFFDGQNDLKIAIPDRGFMVTSSKVQTNLTRVQLQFLGFQNIQYEVRARPSLAEPWQITAFSLMPDGPADRTIVDGQDDFANLYVPTTDAVRFLAVAMRLREV